MSVAERFQALVSVAESITSCREPEELFRRLAGQLQRVVTFDFLGLVRYEPEQGLTRPQVLETASKMFTTPLELPIEEHPAGWVIETQRALIVADTSAETRWPQVMTRIRQQAIASFCLLPLTTARGPLGTLGFARRERTTYAAADVEFLAEVTKLVAVALENALMQRQLAAERDHLRLLLDVTNALVSHLDLSELIAVVSSSLQRAIPHEYTALTLHDEPESAELVVHAAVFKSRSGSAYECRSIPIANSPPGVVFTRAAHTCSARKS